MAVIGFLKETKEGEKRSSVLPSTITKYNKLGFEILVEEDIASHLGVANEDFELVENASVMQRDMILAQASIICTVNKLTERDLRAIGQSQKTVISFFDPYLNPHYLDVLQEQAVSSISMEMVPRISRCQKMDALSSQASITGYGAVMLAAHHFHRALPMMTTSAGTIKPADVFVIGAGVAGLQAIATAKRLGANVTAFDTRSEVEEQVRSLGAKFLNVSLGETKKTADGYATALTEEQLIIQKQAQRECIRNSDIVITTAQVFGRPPPQLIDNQTISTMKRGSVLVDLAVETGGNIEGSTYGEDLIENGVRIIGSGNWPSLNALNASELYANNLFYLIEELWDESADTLLGENVNEVRDACLITKHGEIVQKSIAAHVASYSQHTQ